jgi:HSF-type DNA-binding
MSETMSAAHGDETANKRPRHFVVHDYHDHAQEEDQSSSITSSRIGCSNTLFPMKLHQIFDDIEKDGLTHIASWAPHGRCFFILRPKEFVDKVLPRYV